MAGPAATGNESTFIENLQKASEMLESDGIIGQGRCAAFWRANTFASKFLMSRALRLNTPKFAVRPGRTGYFDVAREAKNTETPRHTV